MYIHKFCLNTVLCYFPALEIFHSTSDDSALLSQCLLCLYFRLDGLRGEKEMRMHTLRNEKVFSKVLTSLKPYHSTVHYHMLSYFTTSHYHRLYGLPHTSFHLLLIPQLFLCHPSPSARCQSVKAAEKPVDSLQYLFRPSAL